MTTADMVPNHPYVPGLTILRIGVFPAFGNQGDSGVIFDLPLMLPREFRENSPFNIRLAIELLRRSDPEARQIIEDLTRLARDPRSRSRAKAMVGNWSHLNG
jgi:hypothetical protein